MSLKYSVFRFLHEESMTLPAPLEGEKMCKSSFSRSPLAKAQIHDHRATNFLDNQFVLVSNQTENWDN